MAKAASKAKREKPKPYFYVNDRIPGRALEYKIGISINRPEEDRQGDYNTIVPENEFRLVLRTDDARPLEKAVWERFKPRLIPHKKGTTPSEVIQGVHLNQLLRAVFREARRLKMPIYEYKLTPDRPIKGLKSRRPYRDQYFYEELSYYLEQDSIRSVERLYGEYCEIDRDWPNMEHRNKAFDCAIRYATK